MSSLAERIIIPKSDGAIAFRQSSIDTKDFS